MLFISSVGDGFKGTSPLLSPLPISKQQPRGLHGLGPAAAPAGASASKRTRSLSGHTSLILSLTLLCNTSQNSTRPRYHGCDWLRGRRSFVLLFWLLEVSVKKLIPRE